MNNESTISHVAPLPRRAVRCLIAALAAGAALSAGSVGADLGLSDGSNGYEDAKLIKIEETGASLPTESLSLN